MEYLVKVNGVTIFNSKNKELAQDYIYQFCNPFNNAVEVDLYKNDTIVNSMICVF
jgi:hypothetical protein